MAVPLSDGGDFEGRIAAWLTDSALPVLAEAVYGGEAPGAAEVIVGRAISGAVLARGGEAPPFEWEGLYYHADPALAELTRFERVRERAGGNSLEQVLAFCRVARGKGATRRTPRRAARAGRELRPSGLPGDAGGRALAPRGRGGGGEGERQATAARSGRTRFSCGWETRCSRTRSSPSPTRPTWATIVGEALPGGNVARRHAFGAAAWRLAGEKIVPGQRWHVEGALPGLDLGLARLQLRR